MPGTQIMLLGPEGRSAETMLSDDVAVASLRDVIARALGLPRGHEFLLRREDGALIDPRNSLSAAKVGWGQRVLVEPDQTARSSGRLGRLGRRQQLPPEDDVIPSAYRVLPCYLTIDTSLSMEGHPIETVNAELPRLRLNMLREPELAEVCQLSLITFDSEARLRTKLTDVSKMTFAPLQAAGRTDYRAPFELLRETIANDLYELYRHGRRPYRPVVFFLSDGKPNVSGNWGDPLRMLADRAAFHGAPNIIAFGFGEATEQAIRAVGQKAAYMPEEGSPSANLDTFMTFLLSSLTTSMTHAARDQDDVLVVPPTAPTGWRALRVPR